MGAPSNRLFEPFLMLLSVCIGLFALSLVNTEIGIGYYQTRKVNLFSELTSKGKLEKAPITERAVNDSMMSKADKVIALKKKDKTNLIQFGSDSTGGLVHFFSSLVHTQKQRGKTRVAYFGDSMIEGDLISQDLRSLFQKMFGGEGVGYMPVTSIVAGFRQTVIHSFSHNWTEYNMLNSTVSDHPIGITGHVFIPAASTGDSVLSSAASSVKYTAVNKAHLNRFCQVKLYYGNSDGHSYVIANTGTKKMDGTDVVNELLLNPYGPVQSISASFQSKNALNIYGFSLESDSGVFVDNLSFRGNSGMPLTKMSYSVLTGLNRYLNYDLIILQYGVNVVNHKLKDYSFYEKGMAAVVQHLRNCFPHSSILIISAGDKGYRENGEIITDPAVPLVVEAQKSVAEKNNCAFWNLFEAMGGTNSMAHWVDGDTTLANKDYTHFNFRGANKIGTLLYNKLISEYSDYKKKS